MLRSIVLICFLALGTQRLDAQYPVDSAAHLRPVLGFRVGPPLRAAFNVGLARARSVGPHGDYTGNAIIVELGSGGGQLSLARVAGSAFGAGRIQLSVLRTWKDPQWVAPQQTYVGLEARMMIGVGVGLGLFGRVEGTTRGDGYLAVVNLVAGI